MTCSHISEWITACVDGAAGWEQRRAVEEHVATCSPCARRLREEFALVRLLSGRSERLVSDGFEARLHAAIPAVRPRHPWLAAWERLRVLLDWRLRGPALAAATGLAIAVVAGLVAPPLAEYQALRAERGQYVELALISYRQLEAADAGQPELDTLRSSVALSTGSLGLD
ncbi:MAG: hypothetical protein FJX77_14455 [Armatimonadetes bacterium]|nr:hypothetical protein [Armatimonadota bacterium]